MHRDFWAERRKPMQSTAQPKEAACDTPFNGFAKANIASRNSSPIKMEFRFNIEPPQSGLMCIPCGPVTVPFVLESL